MRIRTTAVVLLIVLPVFLIGGFAYWTSYEELTRGVYSRREALARMASAVLKEKFDHVVDLGVSLATRVRFAQLVEEKKWNEAIAILQAVPATFPFVERVTVSDATGIQRADFPKMPGAVGLNIAFRDWFRGALNDGRPYVSEIYQRIVEPRLNVVAVAVPIRVAENREISGILMLQIRLDVFFEWGRELQKDSPAVFYFVDKNGKVAGHPGYPNRVVDYSNLSHVSKALSGQNGIEIAFHPIEGESLLTAYAKVPDFRWGAFVSEPVSSAFAPRNRQLRRLLAVYGLLFVMSCLLAYFVVRMLEAMRESNKRAALANRLKSQFLANMSHELRTPLNGIIGFAKILSDGKAGPLNATQKEFLQDILQSGWHLLQLINDVLDLSKIEAGRMELHVEPFSAASVMEEVRANLSTLADKKKIVIRGRVEGGTGEIHLDPQKFKQVLYNLLSNAVKFTEPGGSVDVTIGRRDGKVILEVKDTGTGIKKEDLDRLFSEFQQLDPGSAERHQGTGLGLAITKKIVELQNGRIAVESEFGRGTTFTVEIPTYEGRGDTI